MLEAIVVAWKHRLILVATKDIIMAHTEKRYIFINSCGACILICFPLVVVNDVFPVFFYVKNTCGLRLQPTFPLLKTLLTIRQITKPHSLSAFIFLGVSIIGALVNNVTKVLYEIPNGVRIWWLAYRLYHRNAEPFDKRLLSSYISYIFPAFQLYEHR